MLVISLSSDGIFGTKLRWQALYKSDLVNDIQ